MNKIYQHTIYKSLLLGKFKTLKEVKKAKVENLDSLKEIKDVK